MPRPRRPSVPRAFALCAFYACALCATSAAAQSNEADAATGPIEESPDPTRLDVERLPPEAIEIRRDLYSQGFLFETWVGARGFVGGVGRYSQPGLYANVGFGLEIFRWFIVRTAFEASFHDTNAPSPPTATAFELLGATVEVRLQANFTPAFALWGQGELGAVAAFGDVLRVYGFDQSDGIGLTYGGSLGVDWHLKNRHSSIGLAGGARAYPSLSGVEDDLPVGIHGGAYLRYVL